MYAYEAQVHRILDDAHPRWLTPRQIINAIKDEGEDGPRAKALKVQKALYQLVKKDGAERRTKIGWPGRREYRVFLSPENLLASHQETRGRPPRVPEE